MEEALPAGSRILDGQYCLTRLLYQRPHVNLYLGRRSKLATQRETGTTGKTQKHGGEPLVAIRELVLTELPTEVRVHVEQAAWEEFVSPGVVSSLHLPGTGERMWLRGECERHYLVLQLRAERYPSVFALIEALEAVQESQNSGMWREKHRDGRFSIKNTERPTPPG